MNILFATISNLTGGLINDITTLLVILLTLAFVVMGLDILKDTMFRYVGDTFASMRVRLDGLAAGRSADEIDEDIEESITEAKERKYQAGLKKHGRRNS